MRSANGEELGTFELELTEVVYSHVGAGYHT